MKPRDFILISLAATLGVLVVVFATRISGYYQNDFPGGRFELSRVKMTQLDAATAARLDRLQHDVLITFYVSSRDRMPSEMRRIERDVTDLLDAMKRASSGRLDYQVVDPDAQLEYARHAAHQRVAPFRVRSIARDAYSERTVWSTLHIAYGPHEAAVINGISPAHLPRLQALIVGQLNQKDSPRRATFAIAGPPAYQGLAQWLQRTGEVIHVDLDRGETIPDEVDVLYWMDPQRSDSQIVRDVREFLERGGSVILAGSRHAVAREQGRPISLRSTSYDPGYLLASFGLRPIDGMVLDDISQTVPGELAAVPARFLVRCIPPNQDFREMRELPNGHLLFAVPTPFSLDNDALAEAGLSATVLATTSDRTSLAEMRYGDVNLASAVYHSGDPVPKLPLMVWLRPHEPWRGSLVVSASSSPFQDGVFEADGLAHRRLVDVLNLTLASDERLVIRRADFARSEALPQMTSVSRLFWRLVVIGSLPALMLLVAWWRGVFHHEILTRRAERAIPIRNIAIVVLVLSAAAMVMGVSPSWRFDLTSDRTNRLAAASSAIAESSIDEHAVAMTIFISRSQQFPPELRPMLRRLRSTIVELQLAGADISVRWVHPEDLSATEREQLEAHGIRPIRMTTRDEDMTTVRSVYCSVQIDGSERSEILRFSDRASFEHTEFRLAFALWRLQTGRQPHVVFASDVPRLSAAEAFHDFQQRSLLAPTGTDVYSLARAALEQIDFRVTHLNPRSPQMPDDADVIVWLQPRRDIFAMLDVVIEQLNRGVPVMIAAQQYNMQARQYRGAGFETVYWPQPQVVDLHLHYLPDLGVELAQEVLFDELHGQMQLQTQVNRASGERDYEMQASALPFLVRAVFANFNSDHSVVRNVGDQLLPYAAFWRLNEDRLNELGIKATPLITTSQRSWTYNWTGGWIPEFLLHGPPNEDDEQPQWEGRLPLAVMLEGVFPQPAASMTTRRHDATDPLTFRDTSGDPSRLLLVGCSEMFKNHRLREEAYRADHLLLNAVANLALDADLASIASHRHVSRGFDYVNAETRLRWRAIVIGAGPIAMLLFGLLWWSGRSFVGRSERPS